MKQFDICENLHRATARRAPYVVALQANLLESVDVRLVAPLVPTSAMTPIKRLTPEFTIGGKTYILSMLELVSLRRQLIGKAVGTLATERDKIMSAFDLLILGF